MNGRSLKRAAPRRLNGRGQTINSRPAPGGSPPSVEPVIAENLSNAIERHLKRYFDAHGASLPPPGLYDRIVREVEIPLIKIALDATQGNQLKAAHMLGLNRNTLRKKLREHGISVQRPPQ